MAVSYKKLWKLLIDHDMKKKDLLLLRNALLIEKKLLNAENIMTKSLTISWITVT